MHGIRYTDFVLDSMLNLLKQFSENSNLTTSFIYCSDHGDNIFDYKNTVGHDYAGHLPNAVVEIPFVVWLSDRYMEKYPIKTAYIRNNKDLPFMSDDLFHLILDLQNIETHYFNPSKSVINSNYKIPEKRILENEQEYFLK